MFDVSFFACSLLSLEWPVEIFSSLRVIYNTANHDNIFTLV